MPADVMSRTSADNTQQTVSGYFENVAELTCNDMYRIENIQNEVQ